MTEQEEDERARNDPLWRVRFAQQQDHLEWLLAQQDDRERQDAEARVDGRLVIREGGVNNDLG